jgi:hypothetical protein
MVSTGLEKDPTDTLNDVRAKMLLFKWLEGKIRELRIFRELCSTLPARMRKPACHHVDVAVEG